MANPSTIQIFLPTGEPRGIRIAKITTRIVQAIVVPRNQLGVAAKRGELRNVGIYFLLGEVEDRTRPNVYIGETENVLRRLRQHNQSLGAAHGWSKYHYCGTYGIVPVGGQRRADVGTP